MDIGVTILSRRVTRGTLNLEQLNDWCYRSSGGANVNWDSVNTRIWRDPEAAVTEQPELIERLRALLTDEPSMRIDVRRSVDQGRRATVLLA